MLTNKRRIRFRIITDRPYAVKLAATLQTRQLWTKLGLSERDASAKQFLRDSPEILVREQLRIRLDYEPEIQPADIFRQSGVEIAGYIDRPNNRIAISSKFKRECQRFTLAHEIGHWILHSGLKHHRDRPLLAPGIDQPSRSIEEIEADLFAAELLMPKKYLNTIFRSVFGVDVLRLTDDEVVSEICHAVASGLGQPIRPLEFMNLPLLERAKLIARLPVYRTFQFEPLVQHFVVSPTAMGIQLRDHRLVVGS